MSEPTLLEILEHKIEALDKHVDLRFCALEKARALQAQEYERRLTELNHAHERALKVSMLTTPRELFDIHVSEDTKKHDEVNRYIAANTGRDKGISLVWAVVIAVVGIAMSVAIYLKP